MKSNSHTVMGLRLSTSQLPGSVHSFADLSQTSLRVLIYKWNGSQSIHLNLAVIWTHMELVPQNSQLTKNIDKTYLY